jgi:hypothetical protein
MSELVEYLFNECSRTNMCRGRGYSGSPSDQTETDSVRPRVLGSVYVQASFQFGKLQYSYTRSLYDGTNSGGVALSIGPPGMGLQFVSGELLAIGGDRAALTADFIKGLSRTFRGCVIVCGGINQVDLDATTQVPTSASGEVGVELEGALKMAGLPFENLQAQQVRSNQSSVSVSLSPASRSEGDEKRLLSSLEGRGWRQLSEGHYCKKPLLCRWNFDCKTCKPVYLRMTQFNAEENRC